MGENRYDGASREDLIHAWDQLHGLHNAVLREMLLVTAAMDRRGVHIQDDQRSMRSWLTLHAGVTSRTAGRWTDAAEKVETLPHLAETFASGRISFDKFLTCASFATPETEEDIAREATDGTLSRCQGDARRARTISTDEVEIAEKRRGLRLSWVEDGTRLLIDGSLPAEQGATVQAALDRIADSYPLFAEDGSFPGREARLGDALVDLAEPTSRRMQIRIAPPSFSTSRWNSSATARGWARPRTMQCSRPTSCDASLVTHGCSRSCEMGTERL